MVEEVGEENLAQVITDNASNYKAAGKLLVKKIRNLFWTPYDVHCIDLIFEDMTRIIMFIYNNYWVLNFYAKKIYKTTTTGC